MRLIGLDLGFGNVKIRDKNGGTVFASHLHIPGVDYRLDENDTKDGETSLVEFDGMRYVAGRNAPLATQSIAGLDTERLLGSSEIKASTYAALGAHQTAYSRWNDSLIVYVGVPASLLVGSSRDRNVTAIRSWLIGDHRWEQDGKKYDITVGNVVIRSQAAGALFDMVLNLDGRQSSDALFADGSFGIISIGYNTVELSGGIGGRPVNDMIASSPNGVATMLRNCDRDNLFSTALLDWKLRGGRLNGNSPSVQAQWADNIAGLVATQWKSLANQLDRIIVVGGGAAMAKDALVRRFGDVVWSPQDAVGAIARGLYKRGVADGKKG